MTSAHQWLAKEAAWVWPAVADHLWQATIFALIVLTASLALRRNPARERHSFWLLASVKLIVPTTIFVILVEQTGLDASWLFRGMQPTPQSYVLLEGFTAPGSALAINYESNALAGEAVRHNEVYCALTAVWLIGCSTLLGVWGWRRRRFLEAVKLGRSLQSGREWETLKRAQNSLGLRAEVKLIVVPQKIEPTMCGVLQPVVLLPESLAEQLDDGELEAIMLHELVHIRRRDNLIGNLQMLVCAVFWFYPPVWFISRKLSDEREQACDEKVLEVYKVPETYAASILKVVRFCFGWNTAGMPGLGAGSNLRRRFENIMSSNVSKRSGKRGLLLLAGSLLGLALVLMVAAGMHNRAFAGRFGSVANRADQSDTIALTSHDGLRSDLESELVQKAKKSRKGRATEPPPSPPPPLQGSQPLPPSQGSPAPPPRRMPPPPPPQESPAPSAPRRVPPPPPPRQPEQTPATQPSASMSSVAAQNKTSSAAKNEESSQKTDKRKVVMGELIEAPRPEYPNEARKQKIEGRVTVNIVIGDEGKVISARAASGPSILHDASVAAAYKARFKPTLVDGKPAKVTGALSYEFALDDK